MQNIRMIIYNESDNVNEHVHHKKTLHIVMNSHIHTFMNFGNANL